jgi:hypothetical protein
MRKKGVIQTVLVGKPEERAHLQDLEVNIK